MPSAVVSRLDGVLASLVSERAEAPIDAPIDLAAERGRRRRTWLGGLAAAAVVVAAGVAVPALLNDSGSSDTAMSAADSADMDESAGLPELNSASATADVTAFVRSLDEPDPVTGYDADTKSGRSTDDLEGLDAPSEAPLSSTSIPPRVGSTASQCGWTGSGAVYAVSYDGAAADLVLATRRGRVIAKVITCTDGAEPTVAQTVIVRPGT